jgi:hypothetical protein
MSLNCAMALLLYRSGYWSKDRLIKELKSEKEKGALSDTHTKY